MLCAILLARELTTEDFAAYSYFQMTVAMLSTYAAMGLGVTASRFFAEAHQKTNDVFTLIGTLLFLSLALSITAFIIVLLLPSSWLDAGVSVPQWLIALGVAVTVFGIVPNGGILGLEKYREASQISFLSAICMLIMTGVAVFHQSPLFGMWGIVIGFLVQSVGQLIIIACSINWKRIITSFQWSWQAISRLTSFAGPMFAVSIMTGSSTWIMGRMILADGGELEFSAYSIGLQWFALGTLIPGMVSRVVLPRIVRDQTSDQRYLVRSAVIIALVPALVLAVAGFITSSWLIEFYGSLYSEFALLIPFFLAIAVISAPVNTIGNGVLAKNGQIQWLILHSIAFLVLLVSFSSFPSRVSWWAAMSHMLSIIAMLIMALVLGRKNDLI